MKSKSLHSLNLQINSSVYLDFFLGESLRVGLFAPAFFALRSKKSGSYYPFRIQALVSDYKLEAPKILVPISN
jgi:hypothetical protein